MVENQKYNPAQLIKVVIKRTRESREYQWKPEKRTFWGLILSRAAGFYNDFGYMVTAEDGFKIDGEKIFVYPTVTMFYPNDVRMQREFKTDPEAETFFDMVSKGCIDYINLEVKNE